MSHTYAICEVSAAAFEEIRAKLEAADYGDQFDTNDGRPLIDMHGLALQPFAAPDVCASPQPDLYVLIKDGLFWRPDSAGYTSDLLEAGLYTDAESQQRLDPGSGGHLYPAVTRELATVAISKLAERKRKGLNRVEPRMLELFERAMDRRASENVRHLARVPFVATCGADQNGQKTTDDPSLSNCLDCLRLEAANAEKLAGFKRYVHERLDQMNVPHDPSPAGTAKHGCRVEGRIDWVIDQMVALEDKIEALEIDAPSLCSTCGLDPEIRNLDCAECSK